MDKKTIYLVRGLPGSGKSTFAKTLDGSHWEADSYFYDEFGNYNFKPELLGDAHEWCQNNVEMVMSSGKQNVIVSNTFTTDKEMRPYFDLASKYDYMVTSLVIENRHGNKSIHNVPNETLEKMKKRFSILL